MSENKALRITKKVEISKPVLWLIWLFLFVLPSVLAITGFNYFRQEYIYFSKTDLINQAFNRIRAYNEQIVPESFLKERIKEIEKINPNQQSEVLKSNIDKILCSETLFCIIVDEKTKESAIIKSKKAQNLSINFLKIYISKLLKAYSSAKASKDENIIIREQKTLASALQTLFKSITPITISMNNVSKNYSVLKGGELYFILAKLKNTADENKSVFAVITGEDFYFRNMLQILHSEYPEIRVVFREIDITRTLDEETGKKELIMHSGIKDNNNGLFIIAPASLSFSRHVLHDGKAELNTKYGRLIPFLEYRIPMEGINQDMQKTEQIINKSIIIILLLSAVYFFYISLFGFNPNTRFKTKIMILTIVSAFFPFSIFAIGIYSIENYNRFMTKISVQHRAEVELQFASHELNSYFSEIEDKMKEFTAELNKMLLNSDLKASELLEKLSSISEKIPLSKETIYFTYVPDNFKTISSQNIITVSFQDRTSKDLLEEQNEKIINNNFHPRVVELANEKELIRKYQDYFCLGNEKIETSELGYILPDDGKLLPIREQITTIWYSNKMLKTKNSDEITGIYTAKFEPCPIIYFYLEKSNFKKNNFKSIIDNYEINYAFIPTENSGTASIWRGSGNISQEDKDLCLKNPQSGLINLNNKTIIKKQNQKIPHLAAAIITELVPFNEKLYIFEIIIGIALYLLAVFLFTSKLIDIILIEPVRLLADNAKAIARGGEDWNTAISSGDEFENLNNSFKNLVTGLKERNILKNYVSEDAFTDIDKSDSIKLLPGGEYTEATIVFSAIKDYEKLTAALTPQESIKLLSQYISIAEEVCKKFDGNLDKILGNTVMLVFRDITDKTSHGLRASQAALELVEKANTIEGVTGLYTGIASGKVISGKIGSYSGKLDFTVIGNPVNLAARFKAEAKKGTEQTGIIISGTTIDLTKGKAKVKFLRRTAIKGKAREYNIYELIGIRD